MSFEQHQTEDRRLVILKLLEQANQYTINEFLMRTALEQFGHGVGADRLRTDLTWLKDQDLIMIDNPGGVYVATATLPGIDVAQGRMVVPGVKRPRP